eukprot:scaffold91680_cov98-Cyclotella_meneghiniana.AAC.2
MEDLCQWRGKIPYNNVCTDTASPKDVQVFDQDNNNMAATQSNTYGSSYPASKAVVGDLVLFSHTGTVGASVYPKQGNYIYDRATCLIKQCRGGETGESNSSNKK